MRDVHVQVPFSTPQLSLTCGGVNALKSTTLGAKREGMANSLCRSVVVLSSMYACNLRARIAIH
jgi:hypothetical protein